MLRVYEDARRDCNYAATRFRQMVIRRVRSG
jgi:hypothetical protein